LGFLYNHISIFKGSWKSPRELDGRSVNYISSFFEDYQDLGDPFELAQNSSQMFQGSIFLGDGFLLSYEDRDVLVRADTKNDDVIFPVINGREVNGDPFQRPGRCIINFFDWPKETAQKYIEPFNIVKNKVKPVRDKVKRKSNRENWWNYAEHRPGLYNKLKNSQFCFLVARTTKHLNFSKSPIDRVFTDALFVYVNDKFSKFLILQSSIHNEWARKYSGALKLDLRYSPSNCFVTFPFPKNLSDEMENELERSGKRYHEFRQSLMVKTRLGLTKIYNQLHNSELNALSIEEILAIQTPKLKELKKQYGNETANLYKHLDKTEDACTLEEAVRGIIELRKFHKKVDETVRKAYGWGDINLAHDFYEVDYLPENDRVRFTISPEARKEVLKCLLKLNHQIHEQEKKGRISTNRKANKKKTKIKKRTDTPEQRSLF